MDVKAVVVHDIVAPDDVDDIPNDTKQTNTTAIQNILCLFIIKPPLTNYILSQNRSLMGILPSHLWQYFSNYYAIMGKTNTL